MGYNNVLIHLLINLFLLNNFIGKMYIFFQNYNQ